MEFHAQKESIVKAYLAKQIFRVGIFINDGLIIISNSRHIIITFLPKKTQKLLGKAFIKAHKHMS